MVSLLLDLENLSSFVAVHMVSIFSSDFSETYFYNYAHPLPLARYMKAELYTNGQILSIDEATERDSGTFTCQVRAA